MRIDDGNACAIHHDAAVMERRGARLAMDPHAIEDNVPGGRRRACAAPNVNQIRELVHAGGVADVQPDQPVVIRALSRFNDGLTCRVPFDARHL
jgi:hypothetical protein